MSFSSDVAQCEYCQLVLMVWSFQSQPSTAHNDTKELRELKGKFDHLLQEHAAVLQQLAACTTHQLEAESRAQSLRQALDVRIQQHVSLASILVALQTDFQNLRKEYECTRFEMTSVIQTQVHNFCDNVMLIIDSIFLMKNN